VSRIELDSRGFGDQASPCHPLDGGRESALVGGLARSVILTLPASPVECLRSQRPWDGLSDHPGSRFFKQGKRHYMWWFRRKMPLPDSADFAT